MRLRWPTRWSAPSADGLRYVVCLRLPRANPTAAIASRANAPFSLSMAGLDRVVENAGEDLRRRGLRAVPRPGKDDALGLLTLFV